MEPWKIEQVALAGYAFRVENDQFVFVGETPTQSELDVIFEKYDAKKYQRDRQYPPFGDQLDQIFWEGIDEWKKTIKAVKDKHPKPE